jgi:hypothetical protein
MRSNSQVFIAQEITDSENGGLFHFQASSKYEKTRVLIIQFNIIGHHECLLRKISYHLVIGLHFMLRLRKEPWTMWFTTWTLEHLFRISIFAVLFLIYNVSGKKSVENS